MASLCRKATTRRGLSYLQEQRHSGTAAETHTVGTLLEECSGGELLGCQEVPGLRNPLPPGNNLTTRPGRGGKRGQASPPQVIPSHLGQGDTARRAAGRKRKGTSQGPLHTRGRRGWGWRNGCPFLSLFSETRPFTPEEGARCPSPQQGQRHPCRVRTPQQVTLF